MIYFTSDIHFGHKRIIEHCKRPWKTVDEMNEGLIKNWNDTVMECDQVYVLGDLSFMGKTRTAEVLGRLRGHKFLVRGNHDKSFKDAFLLEHFKWVKDYYKLKVSGHSQEPQEIVLFHFPIRSWDKMHHGVWHLHGHSHGSLPDQGGKIMDVGVDCHDWKPISFPEIQKFMLERQFKPVDHHKRGKNDRPKGDSDTANTEKGAEASGDGRDAGLSEPLSKD